MSISIHSPRMGRDTDMVRAVLTGQNFNPLSPHGERRQARDRCQAWDAISIHSPRMGRDPNPENISNFARRISIHSPRMGRDFGAGVIPPLRKISIHSPRMGRDLAQDVTRGMHEFQSTLPAWGETGLAPTVTAEEMISIHSPRMGRDQRTGDNNPRVWNFNPLSPHGERPAPRSAVRRPRIFQSTLPAWGETGEKIYPVRFQLHFNPLSPHGERRRQDAHCVLRAGISIHSPRMGRDHKLFTNCL